MIEPCPFKAGQRIRPQRCLGAFTSNRVLVYHFPFEFGDDPTQPDATVTAITEKGFAYEYDNLVPFGRAAWGEMMVGGECYPEGYAYWRAVD